MRFLILLSLLFSFHNARAEGQTVNLSKTFCGDAKIECYNYCLHVGAGKGQPYNSEEDKCFKIEGEETPELAARELESDNLIKKINTLILAANISVKEALELTKNSNSLKEMYFDLALTHPIAEICKANESEFKRQFNSLSYRFDLVNNNLNCKASTSGEIVKQTKTR